MPFSQMLQLQQLKAAHELFRREQHEETVVFEISHSDSPLGGEFAVFVGNQNLVRLMETLSFDDDDLAFCREIIPDTEFINWLASLDASKIKISSVAEGTLIFPHLPVVRIEGPFALLQLLETSILQAISYSSLVATQAARFRLLAGAKTLEDFGSQKAGNAELSVQAAVSSYIGGFDATSNLLASSKYHLPRSGDSTMNAIITAPFAGCEPVIRHKTIPERTVSLWEESVKWLKKNSFIRTSMTELLSFCRQAAIDPENFSAVIDSYLSQGSGLPNFMAVASVLKEMGYQAKRIRLDSGDITYLSSQCRKKLNEYLGDYGAAIKIFFSNEISCEVLQSLRQYKNDVDGFCIGTQISNPGSPINFRMTLVEFDEDPILMPRVTSTPSVYPGKKQVYRMVNKDRQPILDLALWEDHEEPIKVHEPVLARHPYEHWRRCRCSTEEVLPLIQPLWEGKRGSLMESYNLTQIRKYLLRQLVEMREDHLRAENPTPYKVAVSEKMVELMKELEEENKITDSLK